MFQNLRKKVNAVLPDIENMYLSSANIAQSTSSPNKVLNHLGLLMPSSSSSSISNDHTKIPSTQWQNSDAINFSAGCELLDQNEKIWEELHSANESNAKKAEQCDEIISNLTETIKKRCIDLSDINVSLEIIPNIVQTIENCSTIMIEINDKCTQVENQLFELEDLMELLQLQEKQLDSKFEMAMFKERKLGRQIDNYVRISHQFLDFHSTLMVFFFLIFNSQFGKGSSKSGFKACRYCARK